jgi:diamine N-acetyltransferase
MTIREVTSSDIPFVARLAEKTYTETFGNTMSADELQDALKARSKKYFYSVLEKDTILIALDGEVIVGFIQFGEVFYDSIKTTIYDIELKKLFVSTAHHGKGIGGQLIEAMLAHKRLVNIRNIYLDVYTKNMKAIALYRKYGFQEVGKIPYKPNGRIIAYDLLMKRVSRKED